jgi:hypothetical protein
MKAHALSSLLGALLLGAALPAQNPVCITGVLAPVPGPTICQQGETHWFAAAGVYLKSSTVNLAAHVGSTVRIEGNDVGLLCHVIDVTQLFDPAPVVLVSCGSAMLGCGVRVRVNGPGLGFVLLAASTGRGYQPLGCGGATLHGTVLLGQPIVTLVGQVDGNGTASALASIPPNPAFLGAQLWFQGAHLPIGPVGALELSDVLQVIVAPLLPPCAPTNC